MTPKEKAEELVERLYGCAEINQYTAKRCALIAVDEILNLASFYNDTQGEVTYWTEVKQEIKNI
jgi:hypothetical protein